MAWYLNEENGVCLNPVGECLIRGTHADPVGLDRAANNTCRFACATVIFVNDGYNRTADGRLDDRASGALANT